MLNKGFKRGLYGRASKKIRGKVKGEGHYENLSPFRCREAKEKKGVVEGV